VIHWCDACKLSLAVYIRSMRHLVTIFACFATFSVCAQQYVFTQWGTDDGLPTSTINDITEDPLGFIWLATDGAGLVRFDGNSFSQPIHPDSLPSPFVTVLERDSLGHFWIGTENGPAYYTGAKLLRFNKQPNAPAVRINAIVARSKNEVWFATRTGIFVWNGETFEGKLTRQEVTSLRLNADDVLYTTENGLAGNAQMENMDQEQLATTKKLFAAAGASLLSNEQGTFVWTDAGLEPISTSTNVRDVLVLDDAYWLADAQNGIEIISTKGSMRANRQNGLAFDRVRTLYRAKNGSIWVGSISGLSKLSSRYLSIYTKNQGLPDQRIHAAILDRADNIWVGTASGLSKISPTGITNFTRADGLPMGLALAISEDADGTIWVGTEGGVARLEGNRFVRLKPEDSFVFSIAQYQGKTFVGTASGLYKTQGNALVQVGELDGIVQLHHDGQTLFGIGLNGKIYKLNGRNPEVVHRIDDLDLDTLAVRQLAGQAGGFLALLVQDVGVYICSNGTCTLLDQENSLDAPVIKAVAASKADIWLGTDRGLYRAIIENGEATSLRLFDENSGFLAKESNDRSLFLDDRGELLVGTNSGLYRIAAEAFSAPQPNHIYITGVDLFFNPQTNWKPLTDSLSPWGGVPQGLRLAAEQNYLTFRFASPAGLHAPRYKRYTLKGQDKDWTIITGRNEAIYTDINPGNYTFIVEQSNSPGFESAVSDSIPIVIVPPFYRTWWFWILIVFALGAVVFLWVRYRINQLNSRLALETALAESERKALRLQMNPHFVFNALDAISGFIFQNEPREAVRYLTSFAKLMRLTLESSRETRVPLQNELQLLKNYIELEQLRFGQSFSYRIEVDDEIDPYEDHLPPMLVQPFVENAILHGLRNRAQGKGELTLTFQRTGEYLQCRITDNGVGREKSRALNAKRGKRSLATSITEERIELLSKSLGKPVRFQITDLTDSKGEAAGTEVLITFPQLANDEDA
jgi:ligand-binding sensor domain-containing protein/two-component sensor histidine kinase